MTIIISFLGVAGRMAGDLLTSALGWASSLMFGRVPRSHQIFVVLMMAFSILWVVFLVGLLVPSISSFMLSTTPHPPFIDSATLGFALLLGALFLPLAVGLAGAFVPAAGARPGGLAIAREALRGYLMAPLLAGLLMFLAGVGLVRKVRSRRHGWSDAHVPIVVEPDGYERVVGDLGDALTRAGLKVEAAEAPRVLTLPARLLSAVSGENVRKLRPDRLIELSGRNLRVGVYPSDIAISGTTRDRTRARAAILGRLTATAAHLTTSAEAQRIEDEIAKVVDSDPVARTRLNGIARSRLDAIDEQLLSVKIPTDEWDILYRIRLQVERDLLAGNAPGTEFPGRVAADAQGA